MSDFIDVFVSIDTNHVLEKYPNPSTNPKSPTPIAHDYAYMTAASKYVKAGQATADLEIYALRGDSVRWRATSLSGNTSQSANLYDIEYHKDDRIMRFRPSQAGYAETTELERAKPIPEEKDNEVPDATKYVSKDQYDFFIQGDVIETGIEHYFVKFYITEIIREAGKAPRMVTKGYFQWDPAVHAVKP